MEITYKTDFTPSVDDIVEVYDNSGLVRPTTDKERIGKMFKNSDLVVTAWDGDTLVGIARSVTDFCYCCYLSDLAVKKDYQKAGIGKQLVYKTKETIGEQTMLLLLAAPSAMEYYPKIGMDSVDNGFIIKREK
ncbi:acetyltransferase (GNAT) family protein [Mucilaginibacter frigoritolerans]|uniref:Acetyltransferase (GNAT) family protein n=1 Tax=Mucilaginibacter frigoritolerans TaxID=652788 RepID=A0A562U962_9SPHI|nr:GNAT family N-acetyltransferase [Mucilaginibacter frigoritolerans]TWJ02363.1 acetyltransferase (GNAT) family protein [Mucilaginibacter frigoritolerans]